MDFIFLFYVASIAFNDNKLIFKDRKMIILNTILSDISNENGTIQQANPFASLNPH